MLAVAIAPASAAQASGGPDIAQAPQASTGSTLAGNTATDGDGVFFDPDCDASESWWKLPVKRGDYHLIRASGAIDGFRVFPVGTNDGNLQETKALTLTLLEGDATAGSVGFRVRTTGEMPFYFFTADLSCSFLSPSFPGPYEFEVEVFKGLKLPRLKVGRVLEPGSRVPIRIDGFEGATISDRRLEARLQARTPGTRRWTDIGRKRGVQNGRLAIKANPPRWMRGYRVKVRAIAEGEGFVSVRGRAEGTKIANS